MLALDNEGEEISPEPANKLRIKGLRKIRMSSCKSRRGFNTIRNDGIEKAYPEQAETRRLLCVIPADIRAIFQEGKWAEARNFSEDETAPELLTSLSRRIKKFCRVSQYAT